MDLSKEELLKFFDDKKSNAEIADEVVSKYKEVDRENLRKRISSIRKSLSKNSKNVVDFQDADLKLNKKDYFKDQAKSDKLKYKVGQLEKEKELLLEELEIAHKKNELFNHFESRDKELYTIKGTKSLSSEATAFWIGSDWHIEETVEPSTINFMNEYDLDIAKKSVMNFFANALKLTNICAKDVSIKNVVIGFLGDHINGYIHEEFLEDNSLSPIQASFVSLDLMSSGIKYVLSESKYDLTVVCKTGNHARTTQKLRIATDYKNSYEWMLYQILAREFKHEPRVKFIIDNSYLTYLNVYGRDIRMHHGHYIKFGGGVGGLTIPTNKAIAQWDKERTAYLDVFGHYHQLILDTGSSKFVSNGSIVGYNPYAVSIKAPCEEPKQAFFLIDRDRGKTISAPIFVRNII